MRSDEQRMRDILEAIERIRKYADRGRAAYDADELLQTWIIHHIEIIGEATRAMSQGLRAANPQVPWRSISAMRNILIHSYFRVDLDEVWSVVEHDLGELEKQIRAILSGGGGSAE